MEIGTVINGRVYRIIIIKRKKNKAKVNHPAKRFCP